MIRWKQAKIHADRRDAKDTLAALQLEQQLLTTHQQSSVEHIINEISALDRSIFEMRLVERDARWGPPEPITALDHTSFVQDLQSASEPQQVIQNRMLYVQDQIQLLQDEKKKKVTVEDLKEGFSKTVNPLRIFNFLSRSLSCIHLHSFHHQ